MDNLVQECKNKNRSAQELLFETYSAKVYKTAFIFSRNRILADDITQESFIRIFEKIHTYDESYSLDAWIYKIVINVGRNIIRKHKWETLFNFFSDEQDDNEFSNPSDVLENKDQELIINQLISNLPNKYKEVIILKYFNGFSQEDMSNILEIPVGTVKSRINTALSKLRKSIESNRSIKEVLHYE